MIKLELTEEQYETIIARFIETIIHIQIELQDETDEKYASGLEKEIKMLNDVYKELERQRKGQE